MQSLPEYAMHLLSLTFARRDGAVEEVILRALS